MIESLKHSFSKVGVHTITGGTSKMYMPYLKLKISGRKTLLTGYLAPDRYKPSDFEAVYICTDFVVIVTKDEIITVNEKAQEVASIKIADSGPLVSYQEDGFICGKDRIITLYDVNCVPKDTREVTDEEYKRLKTEYPKDFS